MTRVWFVCVLNSTLSGKLKVKRWLWRKDNQKIGSGEARKGRVGMMGLKLSQVYKQSIFGRGLWWQSTRWGPTLVWIHPTYAGNLLPRGCILPSKLSLSTMEWHINHIAIAPDGIVETLQFICYKLWSPQFKSTDIRPPPQFFYSTPLAMFVFEPLRRHIMLHNFFSQATHIWKRNSWLISFSLAELTCVWLCSFLINYNNCIFLLEFFN